MRDIIIKSFPHFLHGGDYNPEQWKNYPEILAEDMRLMKLAFCNEMTLNIFSWSEIEPEEGKFDFSFLDKSIDDIYKAGGRVILATPSGARPYWLAKKYPEVLRTQSNGIKNHFGERHNHCYSSPIYREKITIINKKLAERYKNNPAVIAWHISNEYNGECYCEICAEEFRKWLQNKYKSIEKLNEQWWTSFWSHKYSDWSEIELPSPLTDYSVQGRVLDFKRFVSYQTTDFMKTEIDAIKSVIPNALVTTNMMGFYDGIDYREMAKELDFVSWDCYPEWKNDISDVKTASFFALSHDLTRSLKNRPFLMMESTPSLVNWHKFNKLKRPNVNELSSLQAVSHGADSVQYFQWRKSRGSVEKFHGAVVDHEGSENTRVFKEVAQLGKRLSGLDEIVGAMPESRVAIIYDWDNRWAFEGANGYSNQNKKYLETINDYYFPLWQKGIDVDIIGREDDFSKYSLIIAPMLYMVDEKLEDKLCLFVENGGNLLSVLLTGTVNENDLCHLGGIPCGKLKKLFGIWNEEIDTLYPDESNEVRLKNGEIFKAIDYCELIHATSSEVKAEYNTDFYKNYPAFTKNSYGKGNAFYVAFRDDGKFSKYIVDEMLNISSINPVFDEELPYGVTAHSRIGDDESYVFLQNFSGAEADIKVKEKWINIENKETFTNKIILKPCETIIVKRG